MTTRFSRHLRILVLGLVVCALSILATGCSPADRPDAGSTAREDAATEVPGATEPEASSAGTDGDGSEVAYEPAYPADVSEEGLSASDVEQHSHVHGAGDPDHHDAGDPDHGAGDHDHGDGDHDDGDHDDDHHDDDHHDDGDHDDDHHDGHHHG